MTDAVLFSLIALTGALAGLRLGAGRLCLALAAMALGAVASYGAGPAVHSAFAAITGWDTLLGQALAFIALYAAASLAACRILLGLLPRPATRRSRLAGGLAGLIPGLLLGGAFFVGPPEPSPFEPVGWVERPFVLLRAFRILRTLTPEEAESVLSIPEVRDVAESEPILRLARDEAILRKMERAGEGGRLALLELAAEPEVKRALEDPLLLSKVRRIDLPAVAGEVARRRAAKGLGGPVAGGGAACAGTGEDRSAGEAGRTGAWRLGHAMGCLLKESMPR